MSTINPNAINTDTLQPGVAGQKEVIDANFLSIKSEFLHAKSDIDGLEASDVAMNTAIDALEASDVATGTAIDALETEVTTARGAEADLNTRLEKILRPVELPVTANYTLLATDSGKYLKSTGNTAARTITLSDLVFRSYLYNDGATGGAIDFAGAAILRGPARLAPGQGAWLEGSVGNIWKISPEDVARDRNEWSALGEVTGQTFTLDAGTGVFSSTNNIHFIHRGNNRRIRLFPNGGVAGVYAMQAIASGEVLYVRYSTLILRGFGSTYLQTADIQKVLWTGAAGTLPEDAIILLSRNANNYSGLLLNMIPAAQQMAFARSLTWQAKPATQNWRCSIVKTTGGVKFTSSNNVLIYTHAFDGPDEYGRVFPNNGNTGNGDYETPEVPPLSRLYVLESDLVALSAGGYLAADKLTVATYWTSSQTIPQGSVLLFETGPEGSNVYGGLLGELYTKTQSEENKIKLLMPRKHYPGMWKLFSNFSAKYQSKTGDTVVVVSGDSVEARTIHTSYLSLAEQQKLPPLCQGDNAFSKLARRLLDGWNEQKYRRWDYPSYFTESGTFVEYGSGDSVAGSWGSVNWDDAIDRPAITRTFEGTGVASVAFAVPINAWRFNFIYRTSSNGCAFTVTVAEGNGVLQVKNAAGTWVEANGYNAGTMLESRSGAGYGNTEYQKRLQFRAYDGASFNSRASVKNVTIAKASSGSAEQLNYWGVEWSEAEFMLTIINAARGAHKLIGGTNNLMNYIRTDVYEKNPDLVFFEIPLLNMGVSDPTLSNAQMITDVDNFFYQTTWTDSGVPGLANHSSNYANYECVLKIPHIVAGSFNTTTKEWLVAKHGAMTQIGTAIDHYRAVRRHIQTRTKELALVDTCEATLAASKSFATAYDLVEFATSDGTHLKDTGTLIAEAVDVPAFDFL